MTDDAGQIVMDLWLRVMVTYSDDWQANWDLASNKESVEAMHHGQAPSCCNRHLKDYEGSEEGHLQMSSIPFTVI